MPDAGDSTTVTRKIKKTQANTPTRRIRDGQGDAWGPQRGDDPTGYNLSRVADRDFPGAWSGVTPGRATWPKINRKARLRAG